MESFNGKIKKQPQMWNREIEILAAESWKRNVPSALKVIALMLVNICRNQQLIKEAFFRKKTFFRKKFCYGPCIPINDLKTLLEETKVQSL